MTIIVVILFSCITKHNFSALFIKSQRLIYTQQFYSFLCHDFEKYNSFIFHALNIGLKKQTKNQKHKFKSGIKKGNVLSVYFSCIITFFFCKYWCYMFYNLVNVWLWFRLVYSLQKSLYLYWLKSNFKSWISNFFMCSEFQIAFLIWHTYSNKNIFILIKCFYIPTDIL